MRVRRLRTLVCVLAMLFALAPIRAGCASDAVTQDEASELLDAASLLGALLLDGIEDQIHQPQSACVDRAVHPCGFGHRHLHRMAQFRGQILPAAAHQGDAAASQEHLRTRPEKARGVVFER